nr:HD domain-containing phosphohydrolase [Paenibacillus taihuensis]
MQLIHLGGLLHDIGKLGIPDYILSKDGALTEIEFCLMKQHPVIGEALLEGVYQYLPLANDNEKEKVFEIVLYHHERPDGKGYPRGLSVAQIPTWAMIMSVADAFDAMTTNRSYRQAMSQKQAMNILVREVGAQFWGPAVSAFVSLMC